MTRLSAISPGRVGRALLGWWHRTPLYLRIIAALVLGVVAGVLLREWEALEWAARLEVPSKLIIRLLGALAPPLILIAVIHALMTAEIEPRVARRLIGLLVLNTLVAILIGLAVANLVRPGRWSKLKPPSAPTEVIKSNDPLAPRVVAIIRLQNDPSKPPQPKDLSQFLESVPSSLLGPLVEEGKVIGVIMIAVAFGIALRGQRTKPIATVEDLVKAAFDSLLVVLHWIIDLVPFGVFGIVASLIGTKGFQPFVGLGAFIGAVILGLLLQSAYYLVRIRLGTWVRPLRLLRGTSDALVMAFSTASSTATMPVTYECLRQRVGLREESASLGALVGSNFNNDGTALYEAMAALFIAQMIGRDLNLYQQVLVVLTSVVASVGAAGIPEAGLVTMTVVFGAVKLPIDYIPLLLTVDWFLDRCRTAINVLGDMNVSCMLDGKRPEGRTSSGA